MTQEFLNGTPMTWPPSMLILTYYFGVQHLHVSKRLRLQTGRLEVGVMSASGQLTARARSPDGRRHPQSGAAKRDSSRARIVA